MAIKFEDKQDGTKPGRAPAKAKAEVGVPRPVETPQPDESDGASELPFAKPLRAEKKGRRK